jgi:hypothetical protein
MDVGRLTVELLRPVPLTPLLVTARIVRPGKRVQLVEAIVAAGETEVARATALRIRVAEVALPPQPIVPVTPTDPMAAPVSQPTSGPGGIAYHRDGVEMRFVNGSFESDGPCTVWMRLRQPVVAGEHPTPLQLAVAVADFGNGVSKFLSFNDYTFINPDLTVALHRLPQGEWVGLDAITRAGNHGLGQAESLLFDEQGPLGRAVQSLYIERHSEA